MNDDKLFFGKQSNKYKRDEDKRKLEGNKQPKSCTEGIYKSYGRQQEVSAIKRQSIFEEGRYSSYHSCFNKDRDDIYVMCSSPNKMNTDVHSHPNKGETFPPKEDCFRKLNDNKSKAELKYHDMVPKTDSECENQIRQEAPGSRKINDDTPLFMKQSNGYKPDEEKRKLEDSSYHSCFNKDRDDIYVMCSSPNKMNTDVHSHPNKGETFPPKEDCFRKLNDNKSKAELKYHDMVPKTDSECENQIRQEAAGSRKINDDTLLIRKQSNEYKPDEEKRKLEGETQRQQMSKFVQADEIRIVIIGKTGTGKSATGNSILGEKIFKSKVCGASITNKCKLGIKQRFGRKLVIVDTPGLYDTNMSNEQVTTEIVKCIAMTTPGMHAILLTVQISNRFTKEEEDTVNHFVAHFGIGIYNFLTVVFTRADDLENDNMTIESYVKDAPEPLRNLLQLSDNRYVPFNNKLTGADQDCQVKELISKINDAVNKNEGRYFTNEMYEAAEKTLRREEEKRQKILQEEERRKIENIRRKYELENNAKLEEWKREKRQLKEEISYCKNQTHQERAHSRKLNADIVHLRKQINEYKQKEANKELADDRQTESITEGIDEGQQELTDVTKYEESIRKPEEELGEKDRKCMNLRTKYGHQLQEVRDYYQQRQNPSDLRDDNRRDCENETGIFQIILSVGKFLFDNIVQPVKNAFHFAKTGFQSFMQ